MDEVTHEFDTLEPPVLGLREGLVPGWHSHQHTHDIGTATRTDHGHPGKDDHRHYHSPRDTTYVYDHHPVDLATVDYDST